MENNNKIINSHEKIASEVSSTPACEVKKPVENNPDPNPNPPAFVNQGAIEWHENRRKWTGDISQRSQRLPKDPILSWSMTYEDLLSTNEPFSEQIPLTEMVDFLVDIWYDEGLFD